MTKLTYPDGYYVSHVYDALNRVVRACEQVSAASCASAAATGATPLLARVAYDPLSRRASVDYRNGTSADYAYTPRGDLTCHDWNFTGTAPASCNSGAPELAYDFSYNGVGQLLSETVSDPLVAWLPPALGTDAYAVNGLNQYSSVKGVSIAHDGAGNVTTDHRGRTYKYSAENQLYTVHEGATLLAQNVYYGDGTRRYLNSASGGVRRFYYDGDQEIAEYDSADGTLLRRYVRLPGSVDEPVLMIDHMVASCTTAANGAGPCERWAHQNRLGSVVAVTSNTGGVLERHQYGPYGEVGGSASGFPFRFTGQKLDAETGLYYYKARFYDPDTGRFLQTDPIGYRDQMNLYAYVANDPVNATDPTGTQRGGRRSGRTPQEEREELEREETRRAEYQAAREAQESRERYGPRRGARADDGRSEPISRAERDADDAEANCVCATGEAGRIQNEKYGYRTVPSKAVDTLARVRENDGRAPDGYAGGRTFENREGRLPNGSYREYDVDPTSGPRNSERIVVDQDTGRAYYTPDHYETFEEINY